VSVIGPQVICATGWEPGGPCLIHDFINVPMPAAAAAAVAMFRILLCLSCLGDYFLFDSKCGAKFISCFLSLSMARVWEIEKWSGGRTRDIQEL